MSSTLQNLADISARIAAAEKAAKRPAGSVTLVAVTKTFGVEEVEAALGAGQRAFGENRVQEAEGKFPALKDRHKDLELHLIGPLQSNKAAEAVALFDAIHSVDRPKIAAALAKEIQKQGQAPKLFVQVNTGAEPQKAGVLPEETDAFLKACQAEYGLTITGLMCIPPAEENPAPHFALLEKIATRNGLKGLSMGMSSDFESAISFGATHVRVGSAIFGAR
jgi:pyridoxal phosphate enzyme (YggS family)